MSTAFFIQHNECYMILMICFYERRDEMIFILPLEAVYMRSRMEYKMGQDNFHPAFMGKIRQDNISAACANETFWIKMQREDQSDCPIVFG